MASRYPETDPRYHTDRIKGMMDDVKNHIREDIGKIDEPRAEAMFETAAEVLEGLIITFTHYEQKSEEAWRES